MPSIDKTNQSSIGSLANQISELSAQISSYFHNSSLPEPDFTINSPIVPDVPEYETLKVELNEAALDILRLINGPPATLRSLIFSYTDLAAFQVALERGFFNHVPLPVELNSEGESNPRKHATVQGAGIAEIAERAGMDEDRTQRVLRLLATQRIFEEVEDGGEVKFQHTASSALLARDEAFHQMAQQQMDDMFKAASETTALIKRSPHNSNTVDSPFYTRFGASMYEYYEENPRKGKRFAAAMSSWSQLDRQIVELRDGYPWQSLKNGKVVDIGGGTGHISIGLARQFLSLHFVVQDISPHQLSQEQGAAIEDLQGRVTFQQHNFFDPEPVHDANAFLLRQCLHNYNDSDCIKILSAVIPALEKCNPKTPLLINDIIMPESGTTTRFEEHHLRQVDMTMLVALGSKQRTEREFKALLEEADARFTLVNTSINKLGVGLLEVHLDKKRSVA